MKNQRPASWGPHRFAPTWDDRHPRIAPFRRFVVGYVLVPIACVLGFLFIVWLTSLFLR